MKKRIFAFVLCLLTCLTFSAIAFATENPIEPTDLCVYEGDVQPRINTACPFGNGIHQMASRGAGFVANDATQQYELYWKPCWQCTNCYLVMVTEGDPAFGYPIGHYATYSASEPVSTDSTVISIPNANSLYYTSSSRMEGFRFYYQA